MTRLGHSTLLLNSKVSEQMTAECWRWRPRWNRLASSASCFGSSACLQSSSSVLCKTAYGLESLQGRLGGTHAFVNNVWQAGDVYKPRDEKRSVFHYHYKAWPDKALPTNPKILVQFLCEVLNKQESFRGAGPIVVHCRSHFSQHVFLLTYRN